MSNGSSSLKPMATLMQQLLTAPSIVGQHQLISTKKELSWFMPEKHYKWSVQRKEGNPTMSPLVNEVINEVKKMETAGLGKPIQARSPFTEGMFQFVMEQIELIVDPKKVSFSYSFGSFL